MSAVIRHGRRTGSSRGGTPEQEQFQMTSHGVRPRAGVKELRQVTVLSKGDWDRIHFQLNKRGIEEERLKKLREEKEAMHELSKKKVEHWSNTIKGARQKKLESRKKREDKDEEERRLLDIEEAQFQAAERKAAIDTAKTKQYYQTDRVKNLHSALTLTEALKEREAQLELKRLKSSAGQGIDHYYTKMEQEEFERAILRDQENARRRNQGVKDTAKYQKSQILDHLREQDKMLEEEKIEGEELRRLAAQYEMEKKTIDEIRTQEASQLLSDNIKQIDDVNKLKNLNNMQEEEEDEECRIFAAAKRKMMKLRAAKEAELHDAKQARLGRIRDKLMAQMQQQKDSEDERILTAQEEKEAKLLSEEKEKEMKLQKSFAAMAENRRQQMSEKLLQVAEEKKTALEEMLVKREADALFQRNETEKQKRNRAMAYSVKGYQKQQIVENKAKAAMALNEQYALDKKNEELVEIEERQFQEYAAKVIKHAEKGGRNTYPLRKAATEGAGGGLGPQFPGKGGVRPSYLTADNSGVQLPYYQRSTTENSKTLANADSKSSLRLGFVW